MLLIIDNFDSFTFNLAQYFEQLGEYVVVVQNNHALKSIEQHRPKRIVISPGPGTPYESGECLSVIEKYADNIPMLGVCLGHQCLAQASGAKIIAAREPRHGKTSTIVHNRLRLFHNVAQRFEATRYHSLAVDIATLPSCYRVDAWNTNHDNKIEDIMAISHITQPLFGIQFHPEAILTQYGHALLQNFLDLTK